MTDVFPKIIMNKIQEQILLEFSDFVVDLNVDSDWRCNSFFSL